MSMRGTNRRGFIRSLAAAIPLSAVSRGYAAMAAPMHKKVKITDVKAMVVRGNSDWNMVKIDTDAGVSGLGEAYWGRGVKDIILGYLRPLIIGQDPLDIEPLYYKMMRFTGGSGATGGPTVTAISGV